MTDDEVKTWLSDDERQAVAGLSGCYGAGDDPMMLARSLAEARKALARTEWGGLSRDSGWCIECDADNPPHKRTCIFATMPRPT